MFAVAIAKEEVRASCHGGSLLTIKAGSTIPKTMAVELRLVERPTCPESDCTENPGQPRHDSDYLSSGYYDALEDPISEGEHLHQIDYEQKHGIPYVRTGEGEKANLKKPFSLVVFSDIECGRNVVARITKRGTCYQATQGVSLFVDSLPNNCAVTTCTDNWCQYDPFEMIPILSDTSGCHSTDTFDSIQVACRPLPA